MGLFVTGCDLSQSIPADNKDNDCDARVDEEARNFIDDDGDGLVDEDLATAPVEIASPPPVYLISCRDPTTPSHTGHPVVLEVSESCKPTRITHKDEVTTGACGRNITREWVATDSCGNVHTAIQTISVNDRTPPSLTPPRNRTRLVTCREFRDTAAVGTAHSLDDCDSNPTTWYEDNLRGCVVWRTWHSHDKCGNVASSKAQTLRLSVDLPTVVFPEDLSVGCSSSIESTVTGRPAVTGPAVCGWNVSGVVTVEQADSETELEYCDRLIARSWRVADVCGNERNYIQHITIVHQSPVIKAPLNRESNCDGLRNIELLGQATVAQSCKSVNMTYTDTLAGTVVTRRWTGVDSCGRSSFPKIQKITLEEDAPRLKVPFNVTAPCHKRYPNSTGWAVLAKDLSQSCFYVDGHQRPTTIDYVDKMDDFSCPGFIVRQWRATSFLGHRVSGSQTITLECTPSLTVPADGEDNDCDAKADEEARNYVDDDGDGLIDEDLATFPVEVQPPPTVKLMSLTAPNSPNYTGWAVATNVSDGCEPVTLDFIDQVAVDICVGEVRREWIAVDACDNVGSASQTIELLDRTPPSLSVPGDTQISCSRYDSLELATTWDDSNRSVLTSYSDDLDGCLVSRKWQARDACGNEAKSQIQIISLSIDPPKVKFPADINVTCLDKTNPTDTGQPLVVSASLCGWEISAGFTIKHDDERQEMSNCDRIIFRRWRVSDVCGNSVTALQTIRILHKNPVLRSFPDFTTSCRGVKTEYPGEHLISFCGPDTKVAHSSKLRGSSVIRKWIAIDKCGRRAVPRIQTIRLHEAPPTLRVPKNVSIQCHESSHPNVTGWATIDRDLDSACFQLGGTATKITYEDQINSPGCPGQLLRRWKARTFMGHVIVFDQIIAFGS